MRRLLMKAAKKVARQLALSKQTACSVRLSSRRTNYLFVTSGHLLPTIQRLFVSLVIIGNPVEKEADLGVFFCCRKHAYISHTWWSHTHTHTHLRCSVSRCCHCLALLNFCICPWEKVVRSSGVSWVRVRSRGVCENCMSEDVSNKLISMARWWAE